MTTTRKLRPTFLGKAGVLSALALAATLLAPASHAQITLISSPSPGDTLIDFSNYAAGANLPYPYTTSHTTNSGLQTLTFTNNRTPANGNHFERNDQQGFGIGSGSAGDFLPGTKLLINAVTGNGPDNALTMTFSQPVSEFGFQYEPSESFLPANYVFTVFQNGVPTFTDTETGVENGTNADGSAPFFGVQAPTNSITSVVVYGLDPLLNGVNADALFIGPVSVGTVASVPDVPEPGALALIMGAGLPFGLLALRRR